MLVSIHFYNKAIGVIILILLSGKSIMAQSWSLQQCIDSALINNKTLQMAQSEIEIASEKNKEAKAALIPKLYGNADYRYYTDLPYQLLPAPVFNGPQGVYKEAQFGVPHNLNVNLSVEVPLFNAATFGAIKASSQAEEISKIQKRISEEQLVFEIHNLYFNAQLITHQIKFIKNGITNAEQLLYNVQLLYSQQMAKGTDADKVKLQLQQLNTQLTRAEAQYHQLVNLLRLHIGIKDNTTFDIEEYFKIADSVTQSTNQSSSEFNLLSTKQLIAKSELQTLKLSHLPSFSLYGTYGTTGYGNYSGPVDFFKTFPVGFAGIKMSWQLFSGSALEHKIIQKKKEIRRNDIQIELLNAKQKVQAVNAQELYNVALLNLNNSKSQLELAQTLYSKTILQQKEGIASLTDVLMSDNTQKEAEQNYLNAMMEVMKAELEIKKQTGNILKYKYKPDTQPIHE